MSKNNNLSFHLSSGELTQSFGEVKLLHGSGESTSKLLDLQMKADSGQLNDITLKVTTTVILFRFFDFSTSIGQVKVLIVSIVSERSISSWLKAKSYKLPQQAHTPAKD